MLAKCQLETNPNIAHCVTLVPRLEYSKNLLDEIIQTLSNKRDEMKLDNSEIYNFDNISDSNLDKITLETNVLFSLELLFEIKNRISKIVNVQNIPQILPTILPIIRTSSAQLFDIHPVCSQKLSELSVHLGSILLDSAVLTKAQFDFNQSNAESAELLDKVKLMADSKINKQYPNLDFFKICNT